MHSRLIEALRRIRETDVADAASVATALLEIVASATESTRVTLTRALPSDGAPVVVSNAHASPGPSVGSNERPARLEVCSPPWSHVRGTLVLERDGGFDGEVAQAAEILGGEVLLRLAHLGATEAMAQATRQLQLLRSLTIGGAEAMPLSDVASRVATEIVTAFRGASVLLHVLGDGQLELVARQLDTGGASLESAPGWARRIPADGPLLQAVAAREKKIVSRPVETLSDPARNVLEPLGVRHLLVAPLLSDERVVGTLSVASRSPSPWPEGGLQLLETAATQLGVAIAQHAVLEQERQLARDLAVINELGALVAQQHELPAVLSTAVHQLARLADVSVVRLRLANAERTELVSVACTLPNPELNLPIDGDSAASHAFRTQQPVIIDEAKTDPRASRVMADKFGARSAMAVPLVARGESIGAIVLVDTRRPRHFTKSEVDRAMTVANLLSPTILNAKIFDDLRRSYDALARAQAELVSQARLAALGQFSAVIAHEVRNPLGVIYNSLGSLRRITPVTDESKRVLDIVAEEAARLNRIVVDLLDFARPYASRPRPARLCELLQSAVTSARRATQELPVQVMTELAAPEDEVLVDGTMLEQALINLIVNAIQASPRDGRVTVRARSTHQAEQLRLCCEVLDEGPGVAAGDTERIFEPFFTTKATGTGLGLAVVRRIAEALLGSIDVARAQSGGALFTLTIPIAVQPEAAPAPPGVKTERTA